MNVHICGNVVARIVYSSGTERQNPTVTVAAMRLMTMKGTSLNKSDARNEPSQRALSLCPNCKNPLTLEMDLHGRKVMRCMKC